MQITLGKFRSKILSDFLVIAVFVGCIFSRTLYSATSIIATDAVAVVATAAAAAVFPVNYNTVATCCAVTQQAALGVDDDVIQLQRLRFRRVEPTDVSGREGGSAGASSQ